MRSKGFTLIELLIVIAVVAVLSTAVVLIINPVELLKQARDSVRLSDLDNLNRAIGFFQSQNTGLPLAPSNTNVYISIPDSASCPNFVSLLPTLPSGWSYSCQTQDNYRKVDGGGWIPVNLASLPPGSPLSVLPVDPVNTVASGLYYTYAVSGDNWELTGVTESDKFAERSAKDGGIDPAMFEIGSNLSITPFAHALAAYWQFDENSNPDGPASGNTSDSSGNGYTATISGGPFWSSSCKVGNCLDFIDNSEVSTPGNIVNPAASDFTAMAWIRLDDEVESATFQTIITQTGQSGRQWFYRKVGNDSLCSAFQALELCAQSSGNEILENQWYHIAIVGSPSQSLIQLFINGSLVASGTRNIEAETSGFRIGKHKNPSGSNEEWRGPIDDVLIYKRDLTDAVIKAIYNATK